MSLLPSVQGELEPQLRAQAEVVQGNGMQAPETSAANSTLPATAVSDYTTSYSGLTQYSLIFTLQPGQPPSTC